MSNGNPEDDIIDLNWEKFDAERAAKRKTHLEGVMIHGDPKGPAGAEVHRDGRKIGRIRDRRDATRDVHNRAGTIRTGSVKDPHYTIESVHRGYSGPIQARHRNQRAAIDDLVAIDKERS